MTWESIKLALTTLYPQYIGSGQQIDDTDNGSTPSALAILVDMLNNLIVHYPYEFEFLKESGTITLDGSTSYDLSSLYSDFKSMYQLYGMYDNQDHPYFSNKEGNITPTDGYTMKGDTLHFTGTAPSSGTATFQYKSKYAVKNSAGTRQRYFLADDDYTVFEDSNIIIFGVGQFINWLSDTKSQDRKIEIHNWYKDVLDNMILHNKQTSQIDSML